VALSREEKVARAQALRAEGLKLREIADEMGYGISTVWAWLNDPDRSLGVARKDSYRGRCEDCEAPTDGSNGRANAPTKCRVCSAAARSERRRAEILDKVREWVRLFGAPPTSTDWSICNARLSCAGPLLDQIEERHEGHTWPAVETVVTQFGTWNAAISAAGFTPLKVGGKRHLREVEPTEAAA
jgi:transposase